MNITITSEDIEEAEKAILGSGHFNEGQIAFIKNLDSIDLDACPGSGKTTALVAKLFILAKYRVWESGSSICVISHTNVAIDEIKEKVASHYPDILTYPNFVGTLQSFIDRYLAMPYYRSLNLADKVVIDDDMFRNQWRKRLNINSRTPVSSMIKARFCETTGKGKSRVIDWSKFDYERYDDFIDTANFTFDSVLSVDLTGIGLVKNTSDSHKALSALKTAIFNDGYLQFGDTLSLAQKYLSDVPNAKTIISRRFGYVFLDEAQDTNSKQLAVLDSLFDVESKCYQRIGDPRQSIYDVSSSNESAWVLKTDDSLLTLSMTNRFGSKIANLVDDIAQQIDTSSSPINPTDRTYDGCYLITYKENEEQKVLDVFSAKLVEIFGDRATSMNVHAVGAIGKKSETKLTIGSYLDTYSKNQKRNRGIYFRDYHEYISTISKVMVLQEGSSIVYERLKSCLLHYVRSNSSTEVDTKLFDDWIVKLCIGTIVVDITSTILAGDKVNYIEVAKYMNETLQVISEGITPLVFSIPATGPASKAEPLAESNTGIFNDIPIEFSTIHAVKGQTHDATILLSTQHGTLNSISGSLSGTDVDYYVKSSASLNRRKLTYVAASRPKYVFAWAIPEAKLASFKQATLDCFDVINC